MIYIHTRIYQKVQTNVDIDLKKEDDIKK